MTNQGHLFVIALLLLKQQDLIGLHLTVLGLQYWKLSWNHFNKWKTICESKQFYVFLYAAMLVPTINQRAVRHAHKHTHTHTLMLLHKCELVLLSSTAEMLLGRPSTNQRVFSEGVIIGDLKRSSSPLIDSSLEVRPLDSFPAGSYR